MASCWAPKSISEGLTEPSAYYCPNHLRPDAFTQAARLLLAVPPMVQDLSFTFLGQTSSDCILLDPESTYSLYICLYMFNKASDYRCFHHTEAWVSNVVHAHVISENALSAL